MNKQKLFAWVDSEWQTLSGSYAVGLVLLPSSALMFAFDFHPLAILLGFAWGLGWLTLYVWRFVVLCRRADRDYDRRIKFTLSKEYRTSESASAAAKRRRDEGKAG